MIRRMEITKNVSFILLGLAVAGALAYFGQSGQPMIPEDISTYSIVLVGWVVLMFPVGSLIGSYLKGKEPPEYQNPGLEKAGRTIGQLERTIVYIFYLGGSLEGIAFLVVAKSIYRFGDLSKAHSKDPDNNDSEVTFSVSEYIILGSLLSYTMAIVGGIIIKLLMAHFGLGISI